MQKTWSSSEQVGPKVTPVDPMYIEKSNEDEGMWSNDL
jgi:hypothetical protein